MGTPKRSCWNYVRDKDSDSDRICLNKGVVEYIESRRPIPGTRNVSVSIQHEDGLPQTSSSPVAGPALRMTAAEVTKLMGKPPMREEYYFVDRAEYYAIFRNGIVTEFAPVTYRSTHGLTIRLPASEAGGDDY